MWTQRSMWCGVRFGVALPPLDLRRLRRWGGQRNEPEGLEPHFGDNAQFRSPAA
jgi:hypothetical protein